MIAHYELQKEERSTAGRLNSIPWPITWLTVVSLCLGVIALFI